jgi:hypothetical protein
VNEQILGQEFVEAFAAEFQIGQNSVRDRHYQLYKDIVFNYRDGHFERCKRECEFFSDPLATSLLMRQEGNAAHPHGFIALNIWDTCYCTWALLGTCQITTVQKSVAWLLSVQDENGGWSCSTQYPLADSDTTAAVLILLSNFKNNPSARQAASRAFVWLKKLETNNGSIKTFDEDFGIPTADTTSATLVARQLWGLGWSRESFDWLKDQSESYWYTDNSRLNSCRRALGAIGTGVSEENWIEIVGRKTFSIRFIGDVYLDAPLWRSSLSLSKKTSHRGLIA